MKYLLEMLVIHWVFSHNFNPFNNQLSARWEIITKIRHLMRPLRARWPVRSRSPTRGTDTAGSIDFNGTRFSFIMIEIMVQLDDRWSNEVRLEMPFINTVSKLTEVRINIAFPRGKGSEGLKRRSQISFLSTNKSGPVTRQHPFPVPGNKHNRAL